MSSALERIEAYVDRHWSTLDTPGLALGLTDRSTPVTTIVRGWANVESSVALDPEHRFQIGSISKGFTAMAVLQEVEAGRIALDAPLTAYLPWFEVPSRFATPVTIHHLLSHTAGLAVGMEAAGDAVMELLLLGETEIGWEPGTRFGYSNAGYKALGLTLEAVSGRPWWELVREQVMTPIGMTDAHVIITNDARRQLAVGYTTPFDDLPWTPEHGLVPSPWFESATADGSICASAEELTAYARLLLAGGRGVLTEGSFSRMVSRVAEDATAPGHVFGYGVKWIDGARLLGHSGSMLGFTAYLLVDVGSGFGAVVLMNSAFGDHRLELVRFALDCLAAEAAGDALPEIPDPPERRAMPTPPLPGVGPDGWGSLAGRYRSWNPWCPYLEIRAHDARLWIWTPHDMLDRGGEELELVPLPDGRYRVGAAWSPDRLAFDTFVDGRAITVRIDGATFTRTAK